MVQNLYQDAAPTDANYPDNSPAISELLNLRTEEAITELMEFYRPLMMSVVRCSLEPALRRKIDASDIVQDACHEVMRRFPAIRARQRGQFWTYLTITIRHKLEDARRRFKFAKSRALHREVSIDCLSGGTDVSLRDDSPVQQLIEQEDYLQLKRTIDNLPEELQQLLRWRFRDNLSHADIGRIVARSPDDVRMLIKRCLKKIRVELEYVPA